MPDDFEGQHAEAVFAMAVFTCEAVARMGVALVRSGAMSQDEAKQLADVADKAAGVGGEQYALSLRIAAERLRAALPPVRDFVGGTASQRGY